MPAHLRPSGGPALAAARLALVSLAVLVSAAAPARAGDAAGAALEVGLGRRSLATEKRGITLAGYGGKGLLPSLGMHDEPMVKAMVVRTPSRTVAFVTTDLVGVQRTMLEALRARPLPAEARLHADDVLISASHTHSSWGCLASPVGAPAIDALFLACCGPFRRDFFDEVVGKVHGALADACADLRPASIGVGSGEVPGLSRNRGRGDGPVDPEVGVVVARDLSSGAVRGVLVNLAAHPVIVPGESFLCSADFPGALQRALERRYSGATALFTQGAEGDQTVRVPEGSYRDAWEKVEATGARLAEAAARIAERAEARPALGVASRLCELELPRPEGGTAGERLRASLGLKRSLFHQVTLGDALFMGCPGEPCARIGLDLKAAAKGLGFRHAFVVGLAQDHAGYFVHAEDYAPGRESSHDYEKSLNFHGPLVGAFLVDVHARRLAPRPIAPAASPAAPSPAAGTSTAPAAPALR